MNTNDGMFTLLSILLDEEGTEWKRLEHDSSWWAIRAIILAKDRSREVGPSDLIERIGLRIN